MTKAFGRGNWLTVTSGSRGIAISGHPRRCKLRRPRFVLADYFGQTAFGRHPRTRRGGVNATNQSGIWAEAAGSVTLVARTGSQAPGLPSGRNFTAFDSHLARNPAGHVAFTAIVQASATPFGLSRQAA